MSRISPKHLLANADCTRTFASIWALALSQWLNFLCNWVKNYVLKTGILDQEIGSHPCDSINKKACQTTQHYSEISLGPKLIVD